MVSLSNDRRPGGGFFFNTDVSSSLDDLDDVSLLSSSLHADKGPHFKPFPLSGWISAVLQALVINGMLVAVFVVQSFFILCVAHAGVWAVVLITCLILHYCHSSIKRCGYLEFSRKTMLLIKIPFLALSLGNTVLMVCIVIVQRFCPSSDVCPRYSSMNHDNYVMIVCCAEYAILLPSTVKYFFLLVQFSRKKPLPDVHLDDLLISCIHSHSPSNEIGFKDEDYREEVLEKQADMICYLKQRNDHLCMKIQKLTSEMYSASQTA